MEKENHAERLDKVSGFGTTVRKILLKEKGIINESIKIEAVTGGRAVHSDALRADAYGGRVL